MIKHLSGSNTAFRLALLVLVSLCLPHPASAGVAGHFQFVAGDVTIAGTDGSKRPAIKGGEINEQESIISGRTGSAQLRMVDNGIVAIRPDTTLKIDEYRYGGKENGNDRGFFSLLKGGFRSITGLIGKLNKESYGIKTPAATIGIRGTDHETIHLAAALPNMPEGTYNKVNTGATVINGTPVGANQAAYTPNLNTPAAILPNIPPIFNAPKSTPQGQGEKKQQDDGAKPENKKQDKDKDGQKQKSAKDDGQPAPDKTATEPPPDKVAATGPAPAGGTTQPPPPAGDSTQPPPPQSPSGGAPLTGGAPLAGPAPSPDGTPLPPPPQPLAPLLPPPPPPPTSTTLVTGTTGTTSLTSGSGTILAPLGAGGVGGDISFRKMFNGATDVSGAFAGGGSIVVEGPDQTILFDSATRFPVVVGEKNANGSMQYSAGTAKFIDAGRTTIGTAEVVWGRYVGADQFVDMQGTRDPLTMNLMFTKQAMNYLDANNYFQNNLYTHTFNIVQGVGNIVDSLGAVYTANISSALTVTASVSPAVSMNIMASNGARNWNLTYTGNLINFYQKNCSSGPCGLNLTATLSSNPSATIKGEAGGVFVGPNAIGALTSFSANAFDGSGNPIISLQGTSAFSR